MDKAESFCVRNNLYNLGWFIFLIVISLGDIKTEYSKQGSDTVNV